MLKTICIVMGVLFLIVGLMGMFDHRMMGMHCNNAHNFLHIASGLLAIYFGSRSEFRARRFSRVFGIVYLGLGLIGMLMGPGTFTLDYAAGTTDEHLFKLIPGYLEFGTSDNAVHILLGAIFCLVGFIPRSVQQKFDASAENARERAGAGRQ